MHDKVDVFDGASRTSYTIMHSMYIPGILN